MENNTPETVEEKKPAIESPEVIVRAKTFELTMAEGGGGLTKTVQFPPLEVDPQRLVGVAYDLVPSSQWANTYTLVQRMSVLTEQQWEDHVAYHEKMKAQYMAAELEMLEGDES